MLQNKIKLPSLQQQLLENSATLNTENSRGSSPNRAIGGEHVGTGLKRGSKLGMHNKEKVKVDIPKGAFNGLLIDGSLDETNYES